MATEILRDDAVALFGADPSRFVVAPMGPQPWVAELMARAEGVTDRPFALPGGEPYVLCISRLYALKNHRRLIEAFGRLVEREHLPHHLVVAGEGDVTCAQLAAGARDTGVGDRVHLLGWGAPGRRRGAVRGRRAVALPEPCTRRSGIRSWRPLRSAPRVSSSAGATAEVAGGAARLVDPEDGGGRRRSGRRARRRRDARPARGQLAAAGAVRVREFSGDPRSSDRRRPRPRRRGTLAELTVVSSAGPP